MAKRPYQMRIDSKGELVFDRLTRWEELQHRFRSFWGLPRRSGIVSRDPEEQDKP